MKATNLIARSLHRAENKPSRMMHRIHEVLERLEGAKSDDKQPVTKVPASKSVQVGGNVVGYSGSQGWTWCEYARTRYK